MIHVRLAGGLGNQLFQLAAACALRGAAHRPVTLGTAALGRYQVRREPMLAAVMALPATVRMDAAGSHMAQLAHRLRLGRFLPVWGVSDRNFARALRSAGRSGPILLDGYFQSGWNTAQFEVVRQLMRGWLHDEPGIRPADADCVMHVRGGDFLTSPHTHVLEVDYYRRAIDALRESHGVRTVQVLTDDLPYAATVCDTIGPQLPGVRLALPHQPGSMRGDFTQLRTARSRVLGNSTFCWWAAALDTREAPTLSPERWSSRERRNLVLRWEQTLPAALSTDARSDTKRERGSQ